jgi:TRAP transporter TAXI family solute receptor
MMRTGFVRGIAVVLASVAATAAWAQPVGIGTSPQGTFTYQLGATIAKELSEALKLQARVQPSSGTGAMIPLVNSGEVDIGLCNSLELYESFHGVGTFDKRPNPNIRTIAVLFPLTVGLFVRADSPIKSVQDLKGKRVAYGFTSQEIIKTTIDAMLATGGLSVKDMQPVLVPNILRGVDEFIAGRVDVTTFALGAPKTTEADAAVGGIRWLDLGNDPAAAAAMRKEFRTAYMAQAQPAANIAGLKQPIWTMHYDYTMFANAELPADRVKSIVAMIAERKDTLAQTTPGFKRMLVERLYNDVGVPFHPGAVAYFKDKAITQTK